MQDIEAKRKLRASEGAHFFFTLIFLVATGIIQHRFRSITCGVNMGLLVDLLFYGLVIWATYILVTIIPRYKNPAIKIFFNFLDICFGIYIFALFVYANYLYFHNSNDCQQKAPVLAFFTELFLIVCYIVFGILLLAILTFLFRRFSKHNPDYEESDDNV